MGDARRNAVNPRRKNVQVAVRVRPLNERERNENARIAVTANTVTGYIHVRERNSRKEFGPFDKVYDTSSRQHDIYADLVKPLIPQLLLGYNATVFAYGQTGTGKTFTMAGESDPNHVGTWQDDPGMGIIPRALQQLFDELEFQNAEEYSVRVSYVELYNEELFDLLARPGSENQRLRIFDDNTRKGSVIISGVEDVSVQSSDDVYDILRKGAEKRRTAATLMNMCSSRSHSVFTVTVVTREGKLPGEDLMKTGKLHLVDLAGSENIGRSGAIEQRAREAGNINQSLLTLGRVITALTSGAIHVPYRESKLTRILQDSLGGKTITTIIATLSPSSTSTEESVNTLEYAARAKNIKNHPEANQTLSRRALLKAYNDEVERLKRDLQAAREKNGVFIDKDNFEKMQEELDAQRDQIEEFTDRIQAYMSQIEKLMNDVGIMDRQYSKLYERSSKLESKLKMRLAEIEQLNLKLAEMESNRDKWRRAAEEVQQNFRVLENRHSELTQTCQDLSGDLSGAYEKIKRLTDLILRNESCLKKFEERQLADASIMDSNIESWKKDLFQNSEKITNHCDSLQAATKDHISSAKNSMNVLKADFEHWCSIQLNAFENTQKNLSKIGDDYSSAATDTLNCVRATLEEYYSKITRCSENLKVSIMAACEQQAQLSSSFEYFVTWHRAAEIEANNKRQELHKEENTLLQNFEAEMVASIKNFVESAKDRRLKLDSFEANTSSNRDAAVSDMRKTVMKKSEEMNSLFSVLESESCTIQNDMTFMKNSISEGILGSVADVCSLNKKVKEESEKNLNNFRDMASKQLDNSEMKHMEILTIMDVLDSIAKETLTEAFETAAHIEQSGEVALSQLCGRIRNMSSNLKKVVNDDVERVVSTGNTPKQKQYQINSESLNIPDVEKMVSTWEGQEPSRRLSFYRRRESILENPSVVLSPQSLKGSLLFTVEEDNEEGTFCSSSSLSHDFPAVNTRRHRVLADRNA